MKIKSIVFGIGALSLMLMSGTAWSEVIRGEVRAINPDQNTIQIQPRGTGYDQQQMTLHVSDETNFAGVQNLNELEVGDTVQVEVEDAAVGQRNAASIENQPGMQNEANMEQAGQTGWSRKLSRGVVNFFTSPIELPRQIDRVDKYEGPAQAWTVGLVQGVGRTLFRAGAGIIEVVTFPFNFPTEEKQPIISPEYAWQNWPTDQSAAGTNQ